jgi:putative ABC transport system permease protein
MLFKSPGFTLIALMASALGIGANTAVFSVINSVMLKPLPYEEPGRLVWISETSSSEDTADDSVTGGNFIELRNQNQSLIDMAGFVGLLPDLMAGGETERILSGSVTSNFFSVLGTRPIIGRTFFQEEGRQGNNHVAVLSNGCWQRRFGADPDVLGTSILLNGIPFTIIGVMPKEFRNVRPNDFMPVEVWTPQDFQSSTRQSTIARLKPDVSIEQAQADLNSVLSGLRQQQNTYSEKLIVVTSLHERLFGDLQPSLYILAGAVGFLLLLACANIANLLLVRMVARQSEIGIRVALGATKGRLVRQVLTESLLLAVVGGGIGALLSIWGVRLLVSLGPPEVARLDNIGIDAQVLGFTFLISVTTGLLFGLFPALQLPKYSLIEALKTGSVSKGAGSRRLRDMLVIAEIALALILVIGAGLMVNSFIRLQNVDLGFNPGNILTGMVVLSPRKYSGDARVNGFYDEMLKRVEALPGIESAAAISEPPLPESKNVIKIGIERLPVLPADKMPDADYHIITSGYFNVAGIPLIEGRLFNEFDNQQSPPVVIISQTMARTYWPGADALGKRISLGDGSDAPLMTVVGIVGDTKNDRLDLPPYPQMFLPNTQMTFRAMFFVARTTANPLKQVSAVKGIIRELDSELALYNVNSLEGMLSELSARSRFNTLLMVIFAAVAVALAAVGIYGVISYTSTQRTREIGVRMALGAKRSSIFQMIIGQVMRVALVGIAVGILGAFALTRLMSSLLFDLEATDPSTFAAASMAILFISLLASYLPAHRATKIDPAIALRHE